MSDAAKKAVKQPAATDKKPPAVNKKPEATVKNSEAVAKKSPAAEPAGLQILSTWKYARPLIACRFDPQTRYLFSGAEDNLVQRWNLADGTATPLAAHDSWVRAIGFSLEGDVAFTAGYDGRLVWWTAAAPQPQPVRIIEAHDGWIRALAVSPDGKLVATCGNDRLVKLWSASDGRLVRSLSGHESHVYNVAFHPSGEFLVSCDLKAALKQWDVRSGKLVRDLSAAALHKYDTSFRADIGGARCLAFSRDGKRLAAGGITNVQNAFAGVGDPAVVVLDFESGKPKIQHTAKESIRGVAWGVAEHPDGYWIGVAGGGAGGFVFYWRDSEPHEFFRFKMPDNGRDMSLASDGLRMAVAHADGQVRIYDLKKTSKS
jgi:WD40 repeat protein